MLLIRNQGEREKFSRFPRVIFSEWPVAEMQKFGIFLLKKRDRVLQRPLD